MCVKEREREGGVEGDTETPEELLAYTATCYTVDDGDRRNDGMFSKQKMKTLNSHSRMSFRFHTM